MDVASSSLVTRSNLPVYLWLKFADLHWVKDHEGSLESKASGKLVIVQRPGHKRLRLEIVCHSRSDSSALLKKFGGRAEALPRNWLERFTRPNSKPIQIGNRLIISSTEGTLSRLSVHRDSQLIIPASLAFGTGEHATTALSLRFLEQLTRNWKRGWSFADLGTGSGILALAAKRFGAAHVTGVDNDPAAISVAKSNARLNEIRGVNFQLADVFEWNPRQDTDVITANLYSDLLVKILAKLRVRGWLILSGILRNQQDELACAVRKSDYELINEKRRGKWVAILMRRRKNLRLTGAQSGKFCGAHRPRYSKTRCNLNSLLMPLSHPIRFENRARAGSLAG